MELSKIIYQRPEFELCGKKYSIGKYNIFAKDYFVKKYGAEALDAMIAGEDQVAYHNIMSEIAWYLSDDTLKNDFKDLDTLKANANMMEQIAIAVAVLQAMGFAQQTPYTQKEMEELLKNKKKEK